MLNLVELESNYLPLIHLVPKMHFVLFSRETRGFLTERRTFRSSFKEDWKSNEAPKKRRKQGGAPHGRAPGNTAVLQWPGPRTAKRTAERLTVHPGTAVRQGPRTVSRFLGLFNTVLLHFLRNF